MNKELKRYLLTNIKGLYKTFDKGHSVSHFNFVTKNCVNYAKALIKRGEEVNLDIAYVAGAYHDVGLVDGREGHAAASGKYVRADAELKKYFSDSEIEIIAEAVEDHSSHNLVRPRNIYGEIVADADRNNSVYLVFSRPIKYGLEHEKSFTKEQHIERVYNFVKEKFGPEGYCKYWLNIPDTTKEQRQVWALLENKEMCKMYLSGLFDEITKGKFNK